MFIDNNSIFFVPEGFGGHIGEFVETVYAPAPYMEAVSNGNGYGLEHLFAAEAYYMAGDMERAERYCHYAINKAREQSQHDIVCNAYLTVMMSALFRGDYAEAKKALDAIHGYIERNNAHQLYELQDCADANFYIRLGDFGKVPHWIKDYGKSNMPIKDGRNRLMHAAYLMDAGSAAEALAAMEPLFALLGKKAFGR
jgi:uncharacterized protein HemY